MFILKVYEKNFSKQKPNFICLHLFKFNEIFYLKCKSNSFSYL